MEEKPFKEQEAVQMVTAALIGMLENNVLLGFGTEPFEGWCEDGDIFEGSEFEDECIALMHKVAPIVDKLTYDFLNLGYWYESLYHRDS